MVVLERSDAAERKRSDIPSEFGLVRLGTLVDLHVGFSGRSGRNKNVSCQECPLSTHSRMLNFMHRSSSVCGTRVCTTQNFGENLIVIKVFDFNMNFPCNARNCTKPLAHFYPRSVDIADWQDKIYTWLPFHVDLRFIEFPADEAGALVLMDEERIFLCDMVGTFYVEPLNFCVNFNPAI